MLKLFLPKSVHFNFQVHHIMGYPKASDFDESIRKISSLIYYKWFNRFMDSIRIVNQGELKYFLTQKCQIPPKKINYWPSFYIDKTVFKPDTDEKKRYDLIFSGRFEKNKGIFVLLEALKYLKKTSPSAKIAITGKGALEKRIIKTIQHYHLEDQIDFFGWVPTIQELSKLYSQSKYLVMTSFNEGGPRVALEAMACGIPVISTSVGIMPDLILENTNGFFIDWDPVDIHKKLDSILRKPYNEYVVLSKNALSSVSHFEQKRLVNQFAMGLINQSQRKLS